MRPDYVNLERKFLDFAAGDDVEALAFKSYVPGFSEGLTWDGLLEGKYVVVLGEPGSGKTWELEAQTERLRNQGQYAFFLRIDALVSQFLNAALDANDLRLFSEWRRSYKDATFLLDSVDEAKLQRPQAFHDALNSLVKGIGMEAIERARVVVTCRVSEWRRNPR